MYEKKRNFDLPQSVEEAAELLIADLLIDHMDALSKLSSEEFEHVYDAVAPYLLKDFKVWSGNNALLNACIQATTDEHYQGPTDPAKIILLRVKEKLCDAHGLFIVT